MLYVRQFTVSGTADGFACRQSGRDGVRDKRIAARCALRCRARRLGPAAAKDSPRRHFDDDHASKAPPHLTTNPKETGMFNTRFTKSLAGAALAAGAFGLAAVSSAATAGAVTASDSTFLANLQQAGISGDSSAELSLGHAVCQALQSGESPQNIVNDVAHATSLSAKGAHNFTLLAAQAYCPQYVQQS
jgi:hypothetical protein